MRRPMFLAACLAALAATAPAAGASPHLVQPGESLSTIAASHGVSLSALAAANGMAIDAWAISGTTIEVPGGTHTSIRYAPAATSQSSAFGHGGHLVRPGESLWTIATSHGVGTSALAAANGLTTTSYVIAGSTLTIPGAAVNLSSGNRSVASCNGCASRGNPIPTAERVSAGQVGDVAQRYGMSRSFVQAVGWQESGFNNALVSGSDARGVMQIIPATWDFINENLAGGGLNPSSARDNVAAGTLYLRYLYRLKGGDRDLTIGSYYQGPNRQSVLPETKTYVKSVLSHKNWFVQNPR